MLRRCCRALLRDLIFLWCNGFSGLVHRITGALHDATDVLAELSEESIGACCARRQAQQDDAARNSQEEGAEAHEKGGPQEVSPRAP